MFNNITQSGLILVQTVNKEHKAYFEKKKKHYKVCKSFEQGTSLSILASR